MPRPKVTRCFWQVYNNAVQLTNWNTVTVIEDKHSSMQLNDEIFAQCFEAWQGSFWVEDQPMEGDVMAPPIGRAHTQYDP